MIFETSISLSCCISEGCQERGYRCFGGGSRKGDEPSVGGSIGAEPAAMHGRNAKRRAAAANTSILDGDAPVNAIFEARECNESGAADVTSQAQGHKVGVQRREDPTTAAQCPDHHPYWQDQLGEIG